AELFDFRVKEKARPTASRADRVDHLTDLATAPAQGALAIWRIALGHRQRCHEPPIEARQQGLLSPTSSRPSAVAGASSKQRAWGPRAAASGVDRGRAPRTREPVVTGSALPALS